jgi:hypothetical protein
MNAALMNHADLPFFETQSRMSSAGRHAPLFENLPEPMGDLVRIIQHLVVYDVVAPDFYGLELPKQRLEEIHIRSVEALLDRILELDDRPLAAARPVEKRVIGRCHHFMLLLIAILRSRRIPARARCGFGGYFDPPSFEDHWVCEYWDTARQRWVLVDTQFDEVWREKLKIEHDILDVPRDRFLVAADAWTRCRAGKADPDRFGIGFVHMHGLWYIAGNLVRDLAALNKIEALPWDVWGAQPEQDAKLDAKQLAYFDQLAALTTDSDRSFDELRKSYATDRHLSVPATVFNALKQRQERFE